MKKRGPKISPEEQTRRNAMMSELVSSYGPRVSRQTLIDVAVKHGVNSMVTQKASDASLERGIYDVAALAQMFAPNMNRDESWVSTSGAATATAVSPVRVSAHHPEVSDEEILMEQRTRFATLDRMIDGVISGAVRVLIIAGSAGIGKTYRAELALESARDEGKIQYTAVKGHLRATGLFRLLWDNKEAGQIILLDDSDAAFQDEQSLGILKAALDSSVRRTISWRTEKNFVDDLGEEIPKTFEYKGSIIFISNINFIKVIEQGKSLAPHMAALVDRSFYIDLNMKNHREHMLRVFDVLDRSDMASTLCLSETQVGTIKAFIKKHHNRLMNGVSLRTVLKLGQIIHFSTSNEDFENVALATCVKR